MKNELGISECCLISWKPSSLSKRTDHTCNCHVYTLRVGKEICQKSVLTHDIVIMYAKIMIIQKQWAFYFWWFKYYSYRNKSSTWLLLTKCSHLRLKIQKNLFIFSPNDLRLPNTTASCKQEFASFCFLKKGQNNFTSVTQWWFVEIRMNLCGVRCNPYKVRFNSWVVRINLHKIIFQPHEVTFNPCKFKSYSDTTSMEWTENGTSINFSDPPVLVRSDGVCENRLPLFTDPRGLWYW